MIYESTGLGFLKVRRGAQGIGWYRIAKIRQACQVIELKDSSEALGTERRSRATGPALQGTHRWNANLKKPGSRGSRAIVAIAPG